MLVVGLTGGIGSGKSTVAKMLLKYGVPVYFADDRAKYLMQNSMELRSGLEREFGGEVYEGGVLNRAYLAEIVFKDKSKLNVLNSLVHPAVAVDFKIWMEEQKSKIVVKEAAILFESGAYKECDINVSISADVEERIRRVVGRDGVDESQVSARINNQWTDEKRNEKADIVIENNDLESLEAKVKDLLRKLKEVEKKEA
ncbi:MAG: dephospho-CoA kinase [Bacteroidota bacterium]